MGDIREEFLKAGLVDKRSVEQIDREKRTARKRARPSGHTRNHDLTRQRGGVSNHGEGPRETSPLKETEARIEDALRIIARDAIQLTPGSRRFYFVDSENRIPFLEVNDDTARKLAEGDLAIVDALGALPAEFALVTSETAVRLAELNAGCIRFWSGWQGSQVGT